MNIEDLVKRNKGPLIAFGGAAGGLLVMIIISAWINMPSDIDVTQIVVNLIWLIFLGLLVAVGLFYVKDRYLGAENATLEIPLEEEILVSLNPAPIEPPSRPVIGDEKKR